VADGSADVALGIHAAARAEGLEFVPLLEERYDLVTPTSVYESGFLDPLVAALRSGRLRRAVRALGGYATRETGEVTTLD
jgi:putative molybdopterin biosynthesis protein